MSKYGISLFLLICLLASGCNRKPVSAVTLTIMGLSLDSTTQLRRDGLDSFTQETGIRVDPIPTLGSSADQLAQTQRLLKEHSGSPDVYLIDVIFPGAIADGLLDLTPYRDANSYSHVPELLHNDTVEGRLVSLPFYVNVGTLYYRTDLLKKYGYHRPPATWKELYSMAALIQRGERDCGNKAFWGYVWQGALYEGLTCNALEWQVSFGGGHIIEPDGTITVHNPRAVEALEAAEQWPGTISPPTVLSYTESDSLNVFASGNAAFLRHWSGGFPARRARDTAVAGRYSLAPLPSGPQRCAQAMGGFQLAVSRYSRHPREAARLVLYLTGRQVQLRRALSGGYLPTIPDLYRSPELQGAIPFLETLQNAGVSRWVARPSTVAGSKYREVSLAYAAAVHSVLSDKVDANSALATLEKHLVELTGFRTAPPQ